MTAEDTEEKGGKGAGDGSAHQPPNTDTVHGAALRWRRAHAAVNVADAGANGADRPQQLERPAAKVADHALVPKVLGVYEFGYGQVRPSPSTMAKFVHGHIAASGCARQFKRDAEGVQAGLRGEFN
eukprot:2807434-Pleurochrysis_carterae.AAC.1